MNTILNENLNIIACSTSFFVMMFGINDEDFITAINGSTICVVTEYYAKKGIKFDISEVRIEEDAMMAVYEHITSIAKATLLAKAAGIPLSELIGK